MHNKKALVWIIGGALWLCVACALVIVYQSAGMTFVIIGKASTLSAIQIVFAFAITAPWLVLSVLWLLSLWKTIISLNSATSLAWPGFFATFSIICFAAISFFAYAAVHDS